MELDPHYVDAAIDRIQKNTGINAKRLCDGASFSDLGQKRWRWPMPDKEYKVGYMRPPEATRFPRAPLAILRVDQRVRETS